MGKKFRLGEVVLYENEVYIIEDMGRTWLHNHLKLTLRTHKNHFSQSSKEVVIGESCKNVKHILKKPIGYHTKYVVNEENLNEIRVDKDALEG